VSARVERGRRRARRRRRQRRRASGRSPVLRALTSGTLALPGIAGDAFAEGPPPEVRSQYTYSHYSEDDIDASKVTPGSTRSRYEIDVHQLRFDAPIGDRFDAGVEIAYETMSGATPWYVVPGPSGEPLQVMTGATIEEQRTDITLSGNYYLDQGRAGAKAGVSVENDYLAISGGVEGERNFNEDNTSLTGGVGFSVDEITPTDADLYPTRPESEDKQSVSVFAGLAHVLGRSSVLQSTLSYQYAQGFLSDPYKQAFVAGTPLGDSRPDQRNQISWLTRYRHSDWGINSHTIEVAWYQALFDAIRLIPGIRYYSQSQADFYAPYYVAPRNDGLYSSDYRLSPFGALSWRIKAETRFQTWNIDWSATVGYERYTSSGDLALGDVKVENPGLVSFNLVSIGLVGRF
jgi:hypothetical protein